MNRLQSRSTIATSPITFTKKSAIRMIQVGLPYCWYAGSVTPRIVDKRIQWHRVSVYGEWRLPISTIDVPLIAGSWFSIMNISVDLKLKWNRFFNNCIRAHAKQINVKKSKNPSHLNVFLSKKISGQKTLFNTFIFICLDGKERRPFL